MSVNKHFRKGLWLFNFFTLSMIIASLFLLCGVSRERIALIRLPESDSSNFQAYQSFLNSHNLTYTILDSITIQTLEPYDLVVVPDWKEDHTFYYALKLYFYFGGRLLGGNWQDEFWARALCSWIWGTDTEKLPKLNQTTADNRAVYLYNTNILEANEDKDKLLSTLLSSDINLPESLSFKTYDEKKPNWSIQGESLFRNEVPVLLRGTGPYGFYNNTSIEEVEKFLSMAGKLGLNFLVLHSNNDITPEHLERCLNLLHEKKFAVMIRIRDIPNQRIGGVVSYKEKPLRDEF